MSYSIQSNNSHKIVQFSSNERIEGTNSSFVCKPIETNLAHCNKVVLLQASIPKSSYNIPANRNTFVVTEEGVNRTISLNYGTYNVYTLRDELQSQLNNGSVLTWSVSYLPRLLKYQFTATGYTQEPVFIFATYLFRQLGFDSGSINTFSVGTLVSVNVINLSFQTRAYIKSDIVANQHNNVLQEVLNYGVPDGSIIFFEQTDAYINARDFIGNKNNVFSFSLVDGFGESIELQGIPWSFSLCFYQRNDVHEIQRENYQIQELERIYKLEEETRKIEEQLLSANKQK